MSTQLHYPVKLNRVTNIALWSLQILVAGGFLIFGGMKLAGSPMMVQTFETIGVGQWFRYVTGSIEVVSSLLLLTPSLSRFSALLLAGTMVGAVLTHRLLIGGDPLPAFVLLALMAIIVYGTHSQTLHLPSKK
jgi:hypothetical protein